MMTNGGDAHVTSQKSGSSASNEATEFQRKHKQIYLVVISKSRNKQAQVTNTVAPYAIHALLFTDEMLLLFFVAPTTFSK